MTKPEFDYHTMYDLENDVYYVSFGTGEPSYCVELTEDILIEVGLHDGKATGLRILNYKRHGHI
jgi:hypothetical protein